MLTKYIKMIWVAVLFLYGGGLHAAQGPALNQDREPGREKALSSTVRPVGGREGARLSALRPDAFARALSEAERQWLAKGHTVRARVAYWPPYMFKEPVPSGAGVDYLRAVAELTGIDVVFVPDEKGWGHALADLTAERRDYDLLLALTPSAERAKEMSFTDTYLQDQTVVIARGGEDTIRSMADLAGKSVAVERSYLLEKILNRDYPAIRQKTAANTLAALRAVATNGADAYIGNITVATYLIQANGLSNLKVVAPAPFEDEGLAMGIRNDWAPLAAILSKGLNALPQEKRIEIRKRWFYETGPVKVATGGVVELSAAQKRYLAEKGVLRMAVDRDWMPFERVNDNGEYEGLLADYMALFSARLGIPFTLYPTDSFQESRRALAEGRCDIIAGDVATDAVRVAFLTSKPYYISPRVFAVHADSPFIRDFREIAGGKIGVLRGSPALEVLPKMYPGIDLVALGSTDLGLRKLSAGEIDAFVNAVGAISHSIQAQGLISVKIGGAIPQGVPLSMLVNRSDGLLVPILDKAVDSLTREDRKHIFDRWISVTYEKGVDYTLIWLVAAFLTGIMGLVVLRSLMFRKANAGLVAAQAELTRKNEELRKLAMIDPLTGLFNRRAIEPLLDKEMSRKKRFGHPVCILILDLDLFKEINDRHGHVTGDRVLAGVACEISSILRETDTMARWGGEEFLILASETPLMNAMVLAEKVREKIGGILFDKVGTVTASIGVADYLAGESFGEWYERADTALYRAKEIGRNRVMAEPSGAGGQEGKEDSDGPFLRLVWREEYASGNATIDGQHRELFSHANEVIDAFLIGSDRQRIEKALERLVSALLSHFNDEEALLAQMQFPGAEGHAGEHAVLRGKAKKMLADYRTGSIDNGSILQFFTVELVANHQFAADRAFFSWIQNRP